MNEEQQQFKEELSGELDRKIFKATLQGNTTGVVIDHPLRLIIPIRPHKSLYGFMDDIKCQSGFEEDDRRGVGKGLVYKGVPFMDVIAQTDIQFYNNWRVYSKCYSNMRFAGWTEMDHNRNLRKICSVFTPSGQYDEGAYIKVTKSTGTIEKTPLPPYEDDVTVVADVAWAKKIELCYTDRNGVEHGVSLPYLLGTGVDTFTRGGKLIKFPAIWRPSNWDSLR